MADPIDTDAIRSMIGDRSDNLYDAEIQRSALCDEVDRLRAENTALAAALEDIADGECMSYDAVRCWELDPADPDEWCSTCVAEVAWCAWRMGDPT